MSRTASRLNSFPSLIFASVRCRCDLDILGTANSFLKHSLVPVETTYPWSTEPRSTMQLQKETVANEDQGKLVRVFVDLRTSRSSPDFFASAELARERLGNVHRRQRRPAQRLRRVARLCHQAESWRRRQVSRGLVSISIPPAHPVIFAGTSPSRTAPTSSSRATSPPTTSSSPKGRTPSPSPRTRITPMILRTQS